MNFKTIKNPRWADTKHSMIDVEVELEFGEIIPYTISIRDVSQTLLYDSVIAGEFGMLSEYTVPVIKPIVFSNLANAVEYKRDEILNYRTTSIALIRGTTTENLNNYESKLSRLMSIAQEIKLNPQNFHGFTFNGSVLSNDDAEILTIASSFISTQILASVQIEDVITKTDASLSQLASAKTIDEVMLIVC